jgi:type IV pilus assembly protein PilV
MNPFPTNPSHLIQIGASLVEVLVAIVIVAIGLLGLAGLQVKMQKADMESYQRTQAVMLLQDMADRINANRTNLASYASLAAGTGSSPTCTGSLSTAQQDICSWDSRLKGAAETLGSTTNLVGAMIGARGCASAVTTDPSGWQQIMLTVVWQGLTPTKPPSTSVGCGLNQYNSGGSCTGDRCRRAITTFVTIGQLN